MDIDVLIKQIIGCAFLVHNTLGSGFLERVYENALKLELTEAGLDVEQQLPLTVYYRGTAVGEYYADLRVEKRIVIELKAAQELNNDHEVQLVHYLQATGMDHGLLINFGSSVSVKRKYRLYREAQGGKQHGMV